MAALVQVKLLIGGLLTATAPLPANQRSLGQPANVRLQRQFVEGDAACGNRGLSHSHSHFAFTSNTALPLSTPSDCRLPTTTTLTHHTLLVGRDQACLHPAATTKTSRPST